MTYFLEKILPVLIDKLAIGFLILVAGYYLNRLLEKYRLEQNKALEGFKGEQNRVLEELKGDEAIRKEYEVLRDKTALQYLQRQIEELYSPLLDSIQYSDIVYKIEKKRIPEGVRSKETAEIKRYFVETYYLPLNSKMAELIRTKIYLLDSDEIPDSFKQFLRHQAYYECLHNLWKDKGITSDEIQGGEWPSDFEADVRNTLNKLRRDYNEYLRQISTAT